MENRTTKRWLWWMADILGISYFVCVFLVGLGTWQIIQSMSFLQGGPTEDVTSAQIENVACITLPSSATDVHTGL